MPDEDPYGVPEGTCLAPVFQGNDQCICNLIIIPGILALLGIIIIIILLGWVPWLGEKIICAFYKLKFKLEHCTSGNDDPCIELWRPKRLASL